MSDFSDKKILTIFGTRPEAIKLAPLVRMLQHERFNSKVCVTGQHQDMLTPVLTLFEIKPDYDLSLMTVEQSLSDITARLILSLAEVLEDCKPDLILVHGDTATTLAATVSAFYHKIPVAHIEAGLRTGNLYSPWPEEGNRKVVGALASLHFAPTHSAKQNLINEGIAQKYITVTGNTVIDALYWVLNKLNNDNEMQKKLYESFAFLQLSKRMILVTGHRRESFGVGFESICHALKIIAEKHPNYQIIYPVHLNPKVQEPVNRLLSKVDNIYLIAPVDYISFVFLMNEAYMIITDSGGIQEEAPSLGKPVLVLRDTTERPEAVKAGTVKLVGTKTQDIIKQVDKLIDNEDVYQKMTKAINPYGDGHACEIITSSLQDYFKS